MPVLGNTGVINPSGREASADAVALYSVDLPEDLGFMGQTCDMFWNSTNIFATLHGYINYAWRDELDNPRATNKALWTDAFIDFTGRHIIASMKWRRDSWVKAWGLKWKARGLPQAYCPDSLEQGNAFLQSESGTLLDPRFKKVPGYNMLNAIDYPWDQFNVEEKQLIESVGQVYVAVLLGEKGSKYFERELNDMLHQVTVDRGLPKVLVQQQKDVFIGLSIQWMVGLAAAGFSYLMYGIEGVMQGPDRMLGVGGAVRGAPYLWFLYNSLRIYQETENTYKLIDMARGNVTMITEPYNPQLRLPDRPGVVDSQNTVPPHSRPANSTNNTIVVSEDVANIITSYRVNWDWRQPWWIWEMVRAPFYRAKTQAMEGILVSLGFTTNILGQTAQRLQQPGVASPDLPPLPGSVLDSNIPVINESLRNIMDDGAGVVAGRFKTEAEQFIEALVVRYVGITTEKLVEKIIMWFYLLVGFLITFILGYIGILGPILGVVIPLLKDALLLVLQLLFKIIELPLDMLFKTLGLKKRN